MGIPKLYKKFLFYYKKHGLKKLILFSLIKFWRRIDNKEIMFLFDLDSMNIKTDECFPPISVEAYESLRKVPEEDMKQLIQLKSEEILKTFLESFFKRGATLWLAKLEDKIVGLEWTLVGGFDGFYSMPMTLKDAIVLALEVFPEFRGKGIAATMRWLIYERLKKCGVSRIFAKVHISNIPELRSLAKTGNIKIGTVRTLNLFSKHITIWDKKTLGRAILTPHHMKK